MAWLIWLAIAVTLIVLETFTVDLVAVWFGISALVMVVITAIFPDLYVMWQAVIFVVLSTVLLLSTRRLVKRLMQKGKEHETNLELVVGHVARVVEYIDNDLEKGAVKINGIIWSARSLSGAPVGEGVLVIVREIRGNKLIVEIKEAEEV